MDYKCSSSDPPAVVVADLGDLCGECPVWDSEDGRLFWTDCVGLEFNCYDPRLDAAATVRKGIEIYGFRKTVTGGWVITNLSGAWLWDGQGEPVPLVAEADGEPCPFNDCCTDVRGRLIAGTIFYAPGTDYRLGSLVVIDLDGSARILDGGYHLANGIGFSPNGATLYATDTVARRIYAYDYDAATGTASGKRVLVELPATEGIPDGLDVDEEGYLWSASWYGGCVNRFNPQGGLDRRLSVNAKQVSSAAFGGPDLADLYITTAGQSETLPVMPPGYDPSIGPFGGQLLRARPGVRGLARPLAAIRPRKRTS